ncbi:methyl-accepting chemotaxis protein [Undibacterium cyanobacteriorum]|uniref:Methyl-accepting chemotaxis protein n=1 Tax=Undibacterium cyanobacteriorum TaxID=3073561 RepID=A0ABY9RIQ1_9BURK|nr:methyl-accepting chemotaxis protein [Undibacterium sp. 20NA77.5]WMW80734.1 methyl-accepting chemotaxis protein [Undibacterium sp. 20NA77.5]
MQHGNPSSDLALSVSINHGLKQVIDISHQINLVAMNAILVAKRAGQQSSGFKVVAMELRVFSQKMEEMMSRLGEMIFHLVKRIADLRKLQRNLNLLGTTINKSDAAAGQLEHSFQAKREQVEKLNELVNQEWQKLEGEVKRSLNLCSSGAMLSHNARIEAAYGGTMLADMQQVAGRIEEIMNLTISYLKQLTNTMKNA